MTYRNRIIAELVVLCSLLVYASSAHAASFTVQSDAEYNVQRNGTPLFCASHVLVNGSVINFTGDCGGPTPPPAGLYASGRLQYGNKGGFITNANLLDWSVLWGRQGVEGNPTPFPGASGATPVWTPGRNQYTCSKFRTGAVGSVTGQIKNSAYYSQTNVNISLSTSCGDFTPAQAACHKEDVRNDDHPALFFDIGGTGTFRCHLSPFTDYYENIRRSDALGIGKISVIGQQG